MGQKQFNDILVVNSEQPYFLFDGVYCIKCFLNSQIQEEKKGVENGLTAGDIIRIENYSFSVDLDEKQQVDLVLNLNKFVCTGKSKKDNFNLQQFKMVNQIEDIYLQTTRKKLILKQQQYRNNLDNYLGSLHIFLNFEKFQQEKEKYMDQVKQEKMQTYVVCKGGLKTSKMQNNLKAVQFYILGENENIDKKVKQEKNDNALKIFLENQNQISQTREGINNTYNFNNNNLCSIRKSKYGMVKFEEERMIQERQLLDIYDPNKKNQGYPKSNKEVRKQRNQAVIVEKQKKKKQRDPRPAFVIRSDSESGEESNEIIFFKDEQKSEFKSENQVQLQKSLYFQNMKIKDDSLYIGKNDEKMCQNWFCKFCNSINVFSKQGCSVCKLPQSEFMQRSQSSQYQLKQQKQSQSSISVSLKMGNMLQNIDQNQRQFTKKRKKSEQKIILIDDDDQEIQNIDIKLHNNINKGQIIEEKKQNFIDLIDEEKKKNDYNDDKEIYFLSEPQKKQKTENKFHYQLKLVQQEQIQHNQQKQQQRQMKKDNTRQIIKVDSDSDADTDTKLAYQKKTDNFINFQNILHQNNGNLGRENMEIEILNQENLVDNQQQQELKQQLNNNFIDIQS